MEKDIKDMIKGNDIIEILDRKALKSKEEPNPITSQLIGR